MFTTVRSGLAAMGLVFAVAFTTGCEKKAVVLAEATLPETTVGLTYSATFSATGGEAPISYAATGIPAGLALDATTGVLSGSPTAGGDFTVAVTATDKVGTTDAQSYPLKVYPAVAFNTASLPEGTAGYAYSTSVSAAGGKAPLTFSVTGAPGGISLDGTTGALAGTTTVAGDHTLTLTATDALGAKATATLTLKVYSAVTFSTSSLPEATAGHAYSTTVAATGGKAPLTFAVTGNPSGISLDTTTGVLSGTASSAGDLSLVVTVTDALGASSSRTLAFKVYDAVSVTTASVPEATALYPYSASFAATGGKPPLSYAITAGDLPPQLTLSGTTLGGVPPSAGTANFTVTAIDANGAAASRAFSLVISPALALTTTALANGNVGSGYAQVLQAAGGKSPVSFSVTSGSLPPGLTLAAGGLISGTPTVGGTFAFTATATDGNGAKANASLQVLVYANPPPRITTATLPNAVTGQAYSVSLVAADGAPPYSWAKGTGTLPAGLSLSASGAITGTPSAEGTGNFQAVVTDSNGQVATRNLAITVYSPVTITTTALPEGYTGEIFPAATLAATGGQAPYTWAIAAGALPPGVTLSVTSGTLSGTPTAAGAFGFTVSASDGSGQTVTKSLSITTYAPPALTTTALPDAVRNASYSQTLAATGGKTPRTFDLATGALPAGLTLATSGAITGTPTTAGTASFTARVTDASGRTATQNLSIAVYDSIAITTGTLADAYVGDAYSTSLTAVGGNAPYTWSLQSGTLPAGITLASNGTLAGTASATASASFVAKVTDASAQTVTKALTLTVLAQPAITTTTLVDAYKTEAYSATVTATGGRTPYVYSLTGGALPTGLSLASSGAISGTATGNGSSFTVTVTDANGKASSQSLAIATYSLPAVVTTSLPNGYVGTAYSRTIGATGGKTPLTFALTSGDTLPNGLALTGAQLSGTPTSAGSSTFTVVVTDANGRTASSSSLTLDVFSPPVVATTSLPDGTNGSAYSASLSATGGKAALSWSITGALPAGLTLNATSGAISGTVSSTATSSTFTAVVTDANGVTGNKQLTISVFGSLTISSTSPLPDAYAGAGYTQALTAGGGRTPYSWSLSGGSLPAGVTLSSTGGLSGTPTTAGTSSFTVTVTDANSNTASKPFTITTIARPAIVTTSLPDGYVGIAYSQTPVAQNGKPPYAFDLAGTNLLPDGLSLDSLTGEIFGTPTTPVLANFTVRLTDQNGLTATRTYTPGIYATPQITTPAPFPDAYEGRTFSLTAAATGGKAPLTWSLASGTLPAGLSLTSSGDVAGAATTAGTSAFTLKVTDANGQFASKGYTQTVRAVPAITTTSLSDGYVGRAYSATISATGGKSPYTFTVSSGAPPAGVTLSAAGALSGTPTTAGSASFTVTATDANGVTASQALALAVYDPPSVSTATVPDVYAGSAYSTSLTVAGGKAPFSWTMTAGALPSGLTLSATGAVSGTTTATGTFTFTASVTDANNQTATKSLTVTALAPLDVATTTLVDAYVTQAYSQTISAVGGKTPYTFSTTAGTLPGGITLDPATGALSGTPSAATNASFTVQVRDANNRTATRALTLAVLALPQLTTTALGDGYVGTAFSGTLAATGGRAPLSFAVTSGALPGGLTLATGGSITGTPVAAGSSTFTVTVTDANGRTGTGSVSAAVYDGVQIVSAAIPDTYLSTASSFTVVGSGGKAPLTFSSTALPAGLTLTAAGVLSGTPTTAGTTSVTFTLRDANLVTTTKVLAVSVLTLPTITTATLADGYVGTGYTGSIAGTGGRAPYGFTSGTLPDGVTLGSDGALSGVPTTAGTVNFTATLTDANGKLANKALAIIVRAPLQVTTTALVDGYVGVAYNQTAAATGGKSPYTWALASGTLPSGVTLDPSTGTLNGTPTIDGTSSITLRVTDANGIAATRGLLLQIYQQPAITSATPLPDAYDATAYSQTLAATGGKAPYGWSITAGGLPAGLTLSTGGVLAGTPTAVGAASFTVQVSDANSRTTTKAMTLTVNSGFNITTASITDGYAGTAFNQTLNASGGATPYSNWTITGGALPGGLTLNAATGVISGTPTAAGTFGFTVQVKDANTATTQKTFSQLVYAAPTVTTASLVDGYTGESYNQTLAATGGKAPYTWALTGGALPVGMSLTSTTGALSGTPTVAGTSTFTVSASDANGVSASKALTVTVYDPPLATTDPFADAYVGSAYSATLNATGGKSPLTWAITAGAVPTGTAFAPSTGVISGTPTTAQTATFTARVTDANGRTNSRSATIVVLSALNVTTSTLADGFQAVAYSGSLAASGGATPYTWSLASGGLPPGVNLTTVADAGQLSGAPTASGTFSFTVRVTDKNGVAATRALSIFVAAPLQITTASLADGYQGTAYSRPVAATGGKTPYTFSLSSGLLPAGLLINAAGTISGTPTLVETKTFVIQVQDANGTTATKSLSIEILNPVSITSAAYPDAYVTDTYSAANTVTGGRGPYTWAISSGALPTGLTLDGTTGAITGTTTGATATFSVSVTDSNSVSASASKTITVYSLPSVTTASLVDAYVGDAYSAPLAASGGKAPLSWSQSAGALPPGLSVGAAAVSGTATSTSANGAVYNFTVRVVDANGRAATRPLAVTAYRPATFSNGPLTVGTEGVLYMRAPGIREELNVVDGKAPVTVTATGLPASLSIVTTAGIPAIAGTPLPGDANTYPVAVQAVDANLHSSTKTMPLTVVAPTPIIGGGMLSTAPGSSKITNFLTVFVVGPSGQGIAGIGVRVRKNGVEYAPVKEALTPASGKVFFSNLGLNGTTDTVDVTVNGPGYANMTQLKLNAALVSIAPYTLPLARPRALAAMAFDPALNKVIAGFGQIGSFQALRSNCALDTSAISTAGVAEERVVPGLSGTPVGRYQLQMANAGGKNIAFGGRDCLTFDVLGDTLQFNPATNVWTKLTPLPLSGGALPMARYRHAMAANTTGQIYMFGGQRSDFQTVNELWRYDVAGNTWALLTPAAPAPGPRMASATTWLTSNRLLMCGGSTTSTGAECWIYDPAGNVWTQIASLPGIRYEFAMASDGAGGAWLFGGRNAGGSNAGDKNDLLRLDGATLAWTTVVPNLDPASPAPRSGHGLFRNPANGEILLFGGRNTIAGATTFFNDLWAWNGTSWQQRPAPTPYGYTVSGTVTGATTGGNALVRVNVSGTSGFSASQRVRLSAGAGSYAIAGIPPGDTIRISAENEDSTNPNFYANLVDRPTLGPVNADVTQNLAFATPAPTSLTATATITPVADWRATSFSGGYVGWHAPGFAGQLTIGNYVSATPPTAGTFTYLPVPAPTTAYGTAWAESDDVATCEYSYAYQPDLSAGTTFALPAGARNVSPGRNLCKPQGDVLGDAAGYGSTSSNAFVAAPAARIDADPFPDVAAVVQASNAVEIFSGRGGITLESTALVSGFSNPSDAALINVGGDAMADLVVMNLGTNSLTVNTNVNGTFGPLQSFPLIDPNPVSMATGDFNNDGRVDVVIGYQNFFGSPAARILLNQGGGFSMSGNPFIPNYSGPQKVVVGKFNADNNLDVATWNQSTGDVMLGMGDGIGGFQPGGFPVFNVPVSPPPGYAGFAAGDVNGDGKDDLVFTSLNSVRLFLQTASGGGFFSAGQAVLPGNASGALIADMNGDGKKDIVTADDFNWAVTVFTVDPAGAFIQLASKPATAATWFTAIDMTLEGELDIVAASYNDSAVYIVPGARPAPTLAEPGYAFTVPAGTGDWAVIRGPIDTFDWLADGPGVAGASEVFTFPLPSTLASSRPTPAGQLVQWDVSGTRYGTFSYNETRWRFVERTGDWGYLGARFKRQ